MFPFMSHLFLQSKSKITVWVQWLIRFNQLFNDSNYLAADLYKIWTMHSMSCDLDECVWKKVRYWDLRYSNFFFSIMARGPKSFIKNDKKNMNHATVCCLTGSMNYKRESVTVMLDRNNYEAHKWLFTSKTFLTSLNKLHIYCSGIDYLNLFYSYGTLSPFMVLKKRFNRVLCITPWKMCFAKF